MRPTIMFKKVFLQELDTAFHHGDHPYEYAAIQMVQTKVARDSQNLKVFLHIML